MSTEQHEALRHAALLNAETWPAHMTLHKWADIAGSTIRTQHALIVQFHTAFEGEHFEHADQREAIDAATQYLKGPKT
tara:strand:- start:458 stop:691 length:234 start_codon:yes stop_codon:yes gene_type:complete